MTRHTLLVALLALGFHAAFAHTVLAAGTAADSSSLLRTTHGAGTDLSGSVLDSLSGAPLSTAEVVVLDGTRLVARVFTDDFGQYTFHNLPPGKYVVPGPAARLPTGRG